VFYSDFLNELKKEQKGAEEPLISGHVENMQDYKFLLGRLQGIKDAISIYETMINIKTGGINVNEYNQ
jgi:hypothetical protein